MDAPYDRPVVKVLCACADTEQAALLRSALEQSRFDAHLEFARSAEECLAALARPALVPDILFLDRALPGADTLDVLHGIAARPVSNALAVVAMVRSPVEAHTLRKRGAYCNGYLDASGGFDAFARGVQTSLRLWSLMPRHSQFSPSQTAGEPGLKPSDAG